MLFLISPAKTLDFETPVPAALERKLSEPLFAADAQALIEVLRKKSARQVAALMDLSPALAELNVARYAAWQAAPAPSITRPAARAFDGDVYDGLDAPSLSRDDLHWAQAHLRILSGLYGLLRPLDLMRPYRLEMGTRWANARGDDLYAFWGSRLARTLDAELAAGDGDPVLVNLASDEYFRAVDRQALHARVVQPVFQDGTPQAGYKVVSFHAKRARGLMARHLITRRATRIDELKTFDGGGYRFVAGASTADKWVFRRDKVA